MAKATLSDYFKDLIPIWYVIVNNLELNWKGNESNQNTNKNKKTALLFDQIPNPKCQSIKRIYSRNMIDKQINKPYCNCHYHHHSLNSMPYPVWHWFCTHLTQETRFLGIYRSLDAHIRWVCCHANAMPL